jgi:putative tryptophan/tyrosine transport system substrate-binding protein
VRRREFIAGLGSVVAWPVLARAQQDGRMRRVGMLFAYPPTDREMQARVQALQQQLQGLGWTKGVNVQFDERWTTDNMEIVRASAANLVELKPDVIVSTGGRVVPVLMRLTRTIPIVIPGTRDPVATGWIESLARPGGNVTGFGSGEPSLYGQMLEMLKEIAPGLVRVAIVYNPDNEIAAHQVQLAGDFARLLAIEPVEAPVHGIADIERVIQSIAQQGNGALLFPGDLTTLQLRDQITPLVVRYRLPAAYFDHIFVRSGGLISYNADMIDIFRRSASYVDRILRGEKASELPFQNPTRYQLIINLKTSRAMGLDIPPTVLARADEVIE